MNDLFFRKPACSSRSFSSSAPFILSNSMRVKTFLGTNRSVIPLQFFHIPKSPFFSSFTRYPFLHSVGTFSCSQIFKNRWCNISVVVIGSAFRACGCMSSGPGVFPSFNIFSALIISAFEGGFVLTLNNISAICMSGLSALGSVLRISLKCSSHPDLCSTSLFKVLPSLSFTGFERFLLFPASVVVISEFLHVSSVHCHFSLCCYFFDVVLLVFLTLLDYFV